MSALDSVPVNQNFQSPQNFKFFIKRAPHLTFFVQKTAVPEIQIDPTWQPTPFTAIPLSGDHITYTPYQLTFKVDEDLKNYLEMMDWLISLGFPTMYTEYASKTMRPKTDLSGITSDLQLLILNSSEIPTHAVNFVDAFPIYLGPLEFDTTSDDVNFITCSVVFRYTHYYIESV
jgi:hypothetical protein